MSEALGAVDYLGWLGSGFDWLDAHWAEETWEDVRAGFLTAIGLHPNQVSSYPVLALFLSYVDAYPDAQSRAVLLDPASREALLAQAQEEYEREVAAATEDLAGFEASDSPGAAVPGDGDAGWVPTAGEPADVAARAAEVIALPALAVALGQVPEIARLAPDQLNTLVAEVLAERVALTSG
jgi:hypothetical protein